MAAKGGAPGSGASKPYVPKHSTHCEVEGYDMYNMDPQRFEQYMVANYGADRFNKAYSIMRQYVSVIELTGTERGETLRRQRE